MDSGILMRIQDSILVLCSPDPRILHTAPFEPKKCDVKECILSNLIEDQLRLLDL
jgi:hypothetical protein